MTQTTTITRRSNSVAWAAGIVTGLLTAAVLAGYAIGNAALVKLFPWSAPMRLPTAAGLFLCAMAVLWLAAGWKRMTAAFAVAAGAIGIEMLREAIFGSLVTSVEAAAFTARVSGQVTTLTGVCMTITAAALLFMSGVVSIRHRLAVVGVLGSVVGSVGAVAVLAYATGMSAAFAAGGRTVLSVHTAFSFALLGAAMTRFAWADSAAGERGAPAWLPALVGIAVLTVTACVWDAVSAERIAALQRTIDFDARLLKDDLDVQVENRIQPLVRLARRRAAVPDLSKQDWESDVQSILTRGGYQSIEWVDASLRAVWTTPPGAGDALPDGNAAFENRRKAAFDSARASRTLTLTRPIDLVTGGKGMLVCVPVFAADELVGYVTGVFRYHLLFRTVLTAGVTSRYSVALFDGSEEIYAQGVDRAAPEWMRAVALRFGNVSWRMRISPGEGLLAEAQSPVGGALPIAGCVLALVLALLVRLALAEPGARVAVMLERQVSAEPGASGISAMPVISYSREGAQQAWNPAARELFGIPLPPITPAVEPFRAMTVAIVRTSAPGQPFTTLLDTCSVPALVFDGNGAFSAANSAAERTLGWSADLWRDRRIGVSTDPLSVALALVLQGQVLTTEAATRDRVLAAGSTV